MNRRAFLGVLLGAAVVAVARSYVPSALAQVRLQPAAAGVLTSWWYDGRIVVIPEIPGATRGYFKGVHSGRTFHVFGEDGTIIQEWDAPYTEPRKRFR